MQVGSDKIQNLIFLIEIQFILIGLQKITIADKKYSIPPR